jgi:hypothetical protein
LAALMREVAIVSFNALMAVMWASIGWKVLMMVLWDLLPF